VKHPREEEIRDLAHASPFAPFTITTSSGERYKVRTADHISLQPEPSHSEFVERTLSKQLDRDGIE
jgi:hypothetical protein